MKKLNLGCGRDILTGYINADISKHEGVDKCFDMEKGIPFKDNYFDEIIAYNCLEQVSNPRNFVFVMNELHRVLNDNGFLILRVPNVRDICAFQDVFDVLKFNSDSFSYMDYKSPRYREFGMIYGYKPFDVEMIKDDRQLVFKLRPIKYA